MRRDWGSTVRNFIEEMVPVGFSLPENLESEGNASLPALLFINNSLSSKEKKKNVKMHLCTFFFFFPERGKKNTGADTLLLHSFPRKTPTFFTVVVIEACQGKSLVLSFCENGLTKGKQDS